MENNTLLSILVIGLVLFLLSNKCREYFKGGNFIKEKFENVFKTLIVPRIERQLENSQKWVSSPMNINPAERTNFPAACATRGMGTPYCRCSAEGIANGECPRACGLNRDREHLVMTSCRNMVNDDPYGGFQLTEFNSHPYQLRG